MPRPGSRVTVHSGRHGPKPPKRIEASIFQRQPSGVLAGADGDEMAQPLEREARVHPPRRRASSSIVPGCRARSALRRRWSSQPEISPATIRVRSCSATSGTRRFDGQPVEVDQMAEAVRLGVGQLDHQRAALAVPDHRAPAAG